MTDRFRLIDETLAKRLDDDFNGDDSPSAVLFAGGRNTSRLTESYYLTKRLSGNADGAVRFYLSRNMRTYLDFAYDCFEHSRTSLAAQALVRTCDICFNSPAMLKDASVSDAHYTFLELKNELVRGDKNSDKALKLAKSVRDFLARAITSDGISSDDVREIIGFMSQSLPNSKSRCVVIENLEFSNLSVCNALLKTLEEPFEKSVMILVSSRPSALLTTILSRVMRYNFLPPSKDRIALMLRSVGSPYDESEYEDVLIYGDGEHLKEIRAAASGFYSFLKSRDMSKRYDVFSLVSPLFKKGYSSSMGSSDVASAFLKELSKIAESDFLSGGCYSLFHSDLAKSIRKASQELSVYNISAQNVIEALMF